PRADPGRCPGDGDWRSPDGGVDGPGGPRGHTENRSQPLPFPLAAVALAEGRDLRSRTTRRRHPCGLRSRHIAGPGSSTRRRVSHGSAHLLLHPSRRWSRARFRGPCRSGRPRSAGAGARLAQGRSASGLVRGRPLPERRGSDLSEDWRRGHRGRHRGARGRRRRAPRIRGCGSLVPQHGSAGRTWHPLAACVRGARSSTWRTDSRGMRGWAAHVVAGSLFLAGCASGGTGRVENGTFNSAKGYQVRLPPAGWNVTAKPNAALTLPPSAPSGAMVVDASCGAEIDRSLPVLARQLTIGLTNRQTVESDTWTIGTRTAAHRVIRGRTGGADVMVEAVVLKGERCVHDFLYV